MAFDYWIWRFQSMTIGEQDIKFSRAMFDAIIESFRFVDPVEPAEGLIPFSSPEHGYELLIPPDWTPTSRGGDIVRFMRPDDDGTPSLALTITVGPTGSATIDELEQSVVSRAPLCPSMHERHEDTMLGGEPARVEKPTIGASCEGEPPAFHHVYAIHNGRPVVLAFDHWRIRFQLIDAIVASFRFTDQATSDGMVTYEDPDAGYSLFHPATWVAGESEGGTRTFQEASRAGSRLYELRITVGDADGDGRLCILTCVDATGIASLEELSEALHDELLFGPPFDTIYGPRYRKPATALHGEASLDGEDALTERYDTLGCCPPRGYYAVYTIHDGRPVVIVFDPGAAAIGASGVFVPSPSGPQRPDPPVAEDTIEAILASFRFTDE
jgi:hypothetical protein